MINNKQEILGFTAGNFDLLHPGYIYTFEEAKRHCDKFIVFLQRDPSQTRFTKYKPVIPYYERYKTLMAIQYIDDVYMYQTSSVLICMNLPYSCLRNSSNKFCVPKTLEYTNSVGPDILLST